MKRYRQKLILPLLLASFVFPLFNYFSAHEDAVCVKRVLDGDTIELKNNKLARYIGIDAPETERKTSGGWVDVHESFGTEAKKVNETLVADKTVRLEFDVQKKDKYNRLLAYCFVKAGDKEIFVQEELLKRGLVYLYTAPPNIKYIAVMVRALEEAKQKKIGVWSIDLSIDANKASQYIGQRKLIEGVVRRSRATQKVIRLTCDGLQIIIFKNNLDLFRQADINPAVFYKNKRVRVYGLVKEYRGETEVIISNPWQIDVLADEEAHVS